MRFWLLTLSLLLASGATAQTALFGHSKVRDFHFTFKQANWWTLLQQSLNTKVDLKADLKVDNITYTDVGIRVKGASSNLLPGNKRPFNLTMDSFKPGQTLYGSTTLNLNNGAMDPTLTREVTAYEIFRNYIPAPRTAYARVHLNNTYWGIYILVEQPNKAMLRQWFADEDGSRYKADRPAGVRVGSSPLTWLGSAVSSYQVNYGIKTAQHPNAWKDLINLCGKLNNTSTAQFKSEIVKWLDVDRALWYIACHNIIVNSDDYQGAGHNYYIYFDPSDGRLNMIPWDQNEAYGVHGPSSNPHAYSILTASASSSRPLVRRLLAVPEWRETYFAHYRSIMRRWTDWSTQIGPLTTKLQNLIRADVQKDTNYHYTMAQFDPAHPRFFSTFHYVPSLKDVVVRRRQYLLGINDLTKPEPQISNLVYPAGKVKPASKVQVTVKVTGSPSIRAVTLRSSVVGAYSEHTMFDDGLHGDAKANDGIWGGSFTAGIGGQKMRFYIKAENQVGTLAFLPEGAEHVHFNIDVAFPKSTSQVLINEVLADNDLGDVDEKLEYEDWLEIYNRGTTAYDLSGHWLSDSGTQPRKWQVPANSIIPAGSFLRVWCDNEPLDGKYHATFKLSKDGESVALYDTDARSNKQLDGVAFGRQKADRSFGRFPDAADEFYYIWEPTGAALTYAPAAIRRYDGRRTGSAFDMTLKGLGSAQVNQTFTWQISGGPASGVAVLLFSAGTGYFDLRTLGFLAIDPKSMIPIAVPLSTTGEAKIPVNLTGGLRGLRLTSQAFSQDLSNALAIWVK
jgi:CotH kinase protein/Lamin Tail Domain